MLASVRGLRSTWRLSTGDTHLLQPLNTLKGRNPTREPNLFSFQAPWPRYFDSCTWKRSTIVPTTPCRCLIIWCVSRRTPLCVFSLWVMTKHTMLASVRGLRSTWRLSTGDTHLLQPLNTLKGRNPKKCLCCTCVIFWLILGRVRSVQFLSLRGKMKRLMMNKVMREIYGTYPVEQIYFDNSHNWSPVVTLYCIDACHCALCMACTQLLDWLRALSFWFCIVLNVMSCKVTHPFTLSIRNCDNVQIQLTVCPLTTI